MNKTVLVIDCSAAVQAQASAACSALGLEALAHTENINLALKKIPSIRPCLVVCGEDSQREITGLDLCRNLRKDNTTKDIPFILLASTTATGLEERAQHAGVNQVIFRPFKSDQLKSVIRKLLKAKQLDKSASVVALVSADSFISKLFERILGKNHLPLIIYPSMDDFVQAAAETFQAVVVDSSTSSDWSWYDASRMGRLVVLAAADNIPVQDVPPGATIVYRPLSMSRIEEAFPGILSSGLEEQQQEAPPLEVGEQSLLAARIAAAVFQKLLQQEAFRMRKWEESCAMIGAEALRLCRNHKD